MSHNNILPFNQQSKQLQQLVELLEQSDFNPYPYSGRAMYGAYCVGFDAHRGKELAAVAQIVAHADNDDDIRADLVFLFERARTDDMGLDTVIYFPDVRYQVAKTQPEHATH